MLLTKDLQANVKLFESMLPIGKSFDIIARYVDLNGKKVYLLFLDGFVNNTVMVEVLKNLQKTNGDEINSAEDLILKSLPSLENETNQDLEKIIDLVLTGRVAIIVEGVDTAVIFDAREYPARSPEESHIEKVTRGPKDDLVETVVFNTALIRRRVRDKRLTFEMKTVGTSSKTDVAVGYLKGKADEGLLQQLRDRLDNIDIHALTMGERSLEELLVKKQWYNPLPSFRVTERPDTIAAHVIEGHIVIMVDTSPTALITPTTLFYFTQYSEDYYQNPLAGTIIRFIRFLSIPISMLLVPFFLLINLYPDSLPDLLKVLLPDTGSELAIFAQVIYLELGLEILQLSSLHTPHNLEAAFSLIGGLILGEIAITMGLFVADTLFFVVASAVANRCIPNPEMANALKVFRWFLIVLTGIFKLWGFLAGLLIITVITATTRTFDKKHGYLWPLIPLDFKALKHLMFCYPIGTFEGKSDSEI